MLFHIMSGKLPFTGMNSVVLRRNIKYVNYKFERIFAM